VALLEIKDIDVGDPIKKIPIGKTSFVLKVSISDRSDVDLGQIGMGSDGRIVLLAKNRNQRPHRIRHRVVLKVCR